MKNTIKKLTTSSLLLSGVLFSSIASADIVPFGIQSNITQQTITDWGFQECSRSGATAATSVASVLSSCQGNILMMAAWDASLGLYGIAAAGETSVVGNVTYESHFTDDGEFELNNWSNGVNFYRTSGVGAWGFTNIASTALYSGDTNLSNGFNTSFAANGTATTEAQTGTLAIGLSWHISGESFTNGWSYNSTGNSLTSLSVSDERVFFTLNSTQFNGQNATSNVSAPAALAGVALLGLAGLRRRRG